MLKALELFGFKSFADRTRFDFSRGITGVVGPNGSGKSNVVDSIKWILGDQSPKSLRGKEMTDVIFNGSSNRKPAGFAEATLLFDNSKRVLSIDADEVHIGRRIYRSGEAEYLINRAPARLKDVRDLFLGTGAGSSAYSIIEQGRVDQLLQATNVNRRIVFEEAAGTSRFRVKKVDAERKLERVAQNLLRLTDIVQEVEKQLNATRSQAGKAAKYRILTGELRALRLGLAADDHRSATARIVELEQQKAEIEARCEELNVAARDFEARQREADEKLSHAEDALRLVEREEAENRETIAGHEATLRHHRDRSLELDSEFARLEQQQAELSSRAREVSGELEQTVDHLRRYGEEFEARREELDRKDALLKTQQERLDTARRELERARTELLSAIREASMVENRVSSLDGQREALVEARRKTQSQRSRIGEKIVELERQFAEATRRLEQERDRFEGVRRELTAALDRRRELLDQQAERQQRLLELREERSALQARKTVLEDLELRQEGLGVGVKEILARAKTDDRAPWSNIRGHVVELLEVDIEDAAILEVALGLRAQLVIVDDAHPLLTFLSEGPCPIAGRVGFLAIPSAHPAGDGVAQGIPSREGSLVDLTGQPGVVTRADKLARSVGPVPNLAEYLLADTWIVQTLADALRLAGSIDSPCRFVTRQGELLEANGTLFVGSVRGETALVSRRSELRGIKTELQKQDRRIAQEEQARSVAARDIQQLEDSSEAQRADVDRRAAVVSDARAAASNLEVELDRLRRDVADADGELDRIDGDLEDVVQRVERAGEEQAATRVRLTTAQTSVSSLESEITRIDASHGGLRDELAREQLALAQHEERLRNLANARTRLDQERLQRDLHREEAERRFATLAARREQIALETSEAERKLADLLTVRDELLVRVQAAQSTRDQARLERVGANETDIQQRHALRELRDRAHGLEIELRDHRHQLEGLAERLRDEYQIELLELASTDQSARSAWEELRAERGAPTETGGKPHTDEDQLPPPPEGDDEFRAAVEERISRCRRRLKAIGHVNADSLKELDELESRYARMDAQLQDLVEAKNTLEEIIRRLNAESRRLFSETFEQIRGQFQELFRKLFGGGEGDVLLEDPNDILECGIEVVARPPGKELRSISLLSGGEKTMTAVALLLAIFKSRPSPFCILDEVDAALDEGNIERYMGVIREFQNWTQFIVITHNKRTMSAADVLYGVTMEEAGVSKRMSVRFDDITEDGHFKVDAQAA
jgi:chromosome segregation protein